MRSRGVGGRVECSSETERTFVDALVDALSSMLRSDLLGFGRVRTGGFGRESGRRAGRLDGGRGKKMEVRLGVGRVGEPLKENLEVVLCWWSESKKKDSQSNRAAARMEGSPMRQGREGRTVIERELPALKRVPQPPALLAFATSNLLSRGQTGLVCDAREQCWKRVGRWNAREGLGVSF